MQRVLRQRDVYDATKLPKSSMYALIARKEFPAPVKLGPRASGWLAAEVEAWLASRIAARDSAKGAT